MVLLNFWIAPSGRALRWTESKGSFRRGNDGCRDLTYRDAFACLQSRLPAFFFEGIEKIPTQFS